MTKVRGRYEVVKADPNKPRGIKNVANVRQDPKDKGRLGTKKPTGKNVANIVGRSARTGQLRSRPTNLSKFPKPRPTIPTPTGALLALLPVAYEQTTEQQQAGSDSMGKTIATRMKDTARDIKGTPAEIAADEKRKKAAAKKKKEEEKKKNKTASKKNKIPDTEVYVDSAVTFDLGNIPKNKVKRRMGGIVKKGYGKALRGY
jgi:hypothetical protein